MKSLVWEEKAAKIWNAACEEICRVQEQEQSDTAWREEEIPTFYPAESIMDYHFGHIVWADFNYESDHIKWCIEQKDNPDYDEMLQWEKDILVESLQKLLTDLPPYEDCEDYKEL